MVTWIPDSRKTCKTKETTALRHEETALGEKYGSERTTTTKELSRHSFPHKFKKVRYHDGISKANGAGENRSSPNSKR